MHDDELEILKIKLKAREKLNHNIHCTRHE